MPHAHSDLRSLLATLRSQGELVEIEAPVDPDLEAAEIHRRVIAAGGPALLFRNVRGADFPLVTNLFGTERRVDLAFGSRPEELVAEAARLPEELDAPLDREAVVQTRAVRGRSRSVGTKRLARTAPFDRERVERHATTSTRLPATEERGRATAGVS